MKRVTIIHRHYWKPSHYAGSSQVYEVRALHNLTDKQLEAELRKMNAAFRTSTWSVKHDFKLSKKSDQREYLKYCLDAYYEPYQYDYDSCQYAQKMIDALRQDFDGLK